MPCDTIQQSQVEFLAKNTDTKLLADALRKMGFMVNENDTHLLISRYGVNGSYEKATGRFQTSGYESVDINEVKREYSAQVANKMAAKQGWQIQWSTNAAGNKQAKVIKRS